MVQNITTFNNLMSNSVYQVDYSINSALLQVNTTFPAKIISLSLDKLTATIETIINPVGVNQKSPQPVQISNVPITREAGGTAGVVIEYEQDDVVLCSVIQRDISLIKKMWQSITARNPASYRKFNIADAVIIRQLTNKLPTTLISITKAGISITSNGLPIQIDSGADNVTVSCTKATVNATNNVTVTASAVSVTATQTASVSAPTTTITSDTVSLLPKTPGTPTALGGTFKILNATITGVMGGSGVTGSAITVIPTP